MSDSGSPAGHRDKTGKVKNSARGKGKKKRNATKHDTEAVSGEELDAHSETSHAPVSPEAVSKVSEGSPGARTMVVNLPGPSPKPRRQNSEENQSPSLSTSTHHRRPSSSPVRHRQGNSAIKPVSSRKQPTSPADDADETESIAESSCGTRARRSEHERIEYFKGQPECGELEPNRAFCTRCDNWINLGKRQTYTVRPWESHRAKCDLKPPVAKDTKVASTEASSSADKAEDATQAKEALVPISIGLSVTASSGDAKPSSPREDKPPSKNGSMGLAVLQADPRAQEIKPYEVLCRACQKWIKLSPYPYSLSNWQVHQQRCSGTTPKSRVATTERKIALLNDPQVKSITSRSVCCACCKGTVMLQGEVEYDHTKWNEHKRTCIPMTPSAPTTASKALTSRLSHVFPPTPGNVSTPTPISRTSSRGLTNPRNTLTDAALVVDSPTAQTGEKRAREEGAGAVEEDNRPSNRPRIEDYSPPEREPPGPWGWFMQPLKAFVRGFREGLGSPT